MNELKSMKEQSNKDVLKWLGFNLTKKRAILGFIGKRIGYYYLCLLIGISFPLLGLYLSGPYFFIDFFEGFINTFYIYFPWSILFIGGITGFIELRMELRKNKLIL